MKKLTLSFLLLLFIGLSAQAQELVNYNYKTYGIAFKAPVGFVIEANTADEFTISDESRGLTFYIRPYKDINVESGLQVAQKAYKELNLTGIQVTGEGEAAMSDGLSGYYFTGTGKQDGNDILFVAIGAIDPNSDVNFYGVGMYYADDKAESNTDLVIKLLQSFSKMK